MILGFKKQFPDGQPTEFKEQILEGIKIHSMRSGDRWRAGMPIQMAYGVRTKAYEQFNKGISELSKCISTQKIVMTINGGYMRVFIDDCFLSESLVELLIVQDGLNRNSFISWFFPNGIEEWRGQIIHWTNFKY